MVGKRRRKESPLRLLTTGKLEGKMLRTEKVRPGKEMENKVEFGQKVLVGRYVVCKNMEGMFVSRHRRLVLHISESIGHVTGNVMEEEIAGVPAGGVEEGSRLGEGSAANLLMPF